MAEQNQQTHKVITLTPSGNVIIPENLKKKVKKPNSDKARKNFKLFKYFNFYYLFSIVAQLREN